MKFRIKTNNFVLFIILLLTFVSMIQCDRSTFGIKKPTFEVEDIGNNKYIIDINAGTNAAIFYTTNGSAPSNDDKRYTEEIEVEKGTQIRAIAICPSGRRSEVTEVTP